MPELLVDFIASLDGYGSAEGWPGYWGMESPEYLAWLGSREQRIALMGATTYRLMSDIAAQYPDEPGLAELTAGPKVVFSSTLTAPLAWANSELVDGDAIAAVRELKESADRPLTTLGSVALSGSLLRAGLVDRLRIVVFPVITGVTGRGRVLDGYPDVTLELLDQHTFEGGLQLLEYRPTVLDAAATGG